MHLPGESASVRYVNVSSSRDMSSEGLLELSIQGVNALAKGWKATARKKQL